MSDRVFTGRDVAEALGTAAQALGIQKERLRYVVLEAGTTGGLGLKPTPARVAVLLGSTRAAAGPAPRPTLSEPEEAAVDEGPPENSPEAQGDPQDVARAIEEVVAVLTAAADIEIRARVTSSADALAVELGGRDVATFLLGPGEPSVAEALEHLLHGMFAHRLAPRRLRVECEGQREQREERVRAKALDLAAAVLADGQLRTTDPLNAYERRLVHMAVAERPGVITYSVGGGADRRVTIAPEKASLGGEVF